MRQVYEQVGILPEFFVEHHRGGAPILSRGAAARRLDPVRWEPAVDDAASLRRWCLRESAVGGLRMSFPPRPASATEERGRSRVARCFSPRWDISLSLQRGLKRRATAKSPRAGIVRINRGLAGRSMLRRSIVGAAGILRTRRPDFSGLCVAQRVALLGIICATARGF
jgi:hypothetical protein